MGDLIEANFRNNSPEDGRTKLKCFAGGIITGATLSQSIGIGTIEALNMVGVKISGPVFYETLAALGAVGVVLGIYAGKQIFGHMSNDSEFDLTGNDPLAGF